MKLNFNEVVDGLLPDLGWGLLTDTQIDSYIDWKLSK